MRVLLDARKLGDGGIGVYLENLILGIREGRERVELTLLVNTTKPLPAWAENLPKVSTDILPYSVAEVFKLGRAINRGGWDIFHTPHYPAPMALAIPLVVTIHDIIHLRLPQKWFYPLYAWPILLHSLLRADGIIAVSQATAAEIARIFGWLPESLRRLIGWDSGRVRVIPNSLSSSRIDGVIRDLELVAEGRYLLGVFSNLKPHKGYERLLAAFKQIRAWGDTAVTLVLAGYGAQELIDRGEQTPDGVKVRGAVSDFELARLYANAFGVVVAADAEGFCLPVLEAHAAGAPAVATPVAAVRELMGADDEVAESFAVSSLAHAMQKLLARGPVVVRPDLSRYRRQELVAATITLYSSVIE